MSQEYKILLEQTSTNFSKGREVVRGGNDFSVKESSLPEHC